MASARCVPSVTSINRLPSPTLHLSFVRYNLQLPGAGNCMQINIASPPCTIKPFVRKAPDKILRGLLFLRQDSNSNTLHFYWGALSALGIAASL